MSLTESRDVPAPIADDVPAGKHGVHAVPRRILIAVYVSLLILTVITVYASTIDVGAANIWIALLIAVIKGSLVALYFMHLRWDSPFNGVILVSALLFVALFIGITLLDTNSYAPAIKPTPVALP